MMRWLSHRQFDSEFKTLAKRHNGLEIGFDNAKRLLAIQFDQDRPQTVIAPGKLHRVHSDADFEMWKLEMAVRNLRPNQFPRIWFAQQTRLIAFLSIRSHVDNYDDSAVRQEAIARFAELK
ncbi:MAG: hypothetical protein LBB58_06120 [Cellulomonadaceae bacterium]|jgi:hypothetical protein|nr:hypothetical protein [Cellulomonadaceae bacterium]